MERLNDPRATIRLLAATAVREATRNSAQAREDLWRAGAIPPLVNLLQEQDMGVCYMATVALLNLAIGSIRCPLFLPFPMACRREASTRQGEAQVGNTIPGTFNWILSESCCRESSVVSLNNLFRRRAILALSNAMRASFSRACLVAHGSLSWRFSTRKLRNSVTCGIAVGERDEVSAKQLLSADRVFVVPSGFRLEKNE